MNFNHIAFSCSFCYSSYQMISNLMFQATGFSSVFSFLLISSLLSVASTPMNCYPASCGNVTNITFPFWLNGHQPNYCGFPDFELTCQNNSTLVLEMSSEAYHVKEIFYKNQSLVLSNPNIINEGCPVPHFNLSFSLSPFTISPINKQLIFFHGCPSNPNYYQVPCGSNGTFAYLGGGYENSELFSLGNGCQTAVAPVLGYPGADGSDYLRLLENGFLAEWVVSNCTECRVSGGQCGYNHEADNFMCLCRDRIQWRSCISSTKKSGAIKIGVAVGMVCFLSASLLFVLYIRRHTKIFNSCVLRKKNSSTDQKIEAFLEKYGSLAPKRYSYSDIKRITKSFRDKLGHGGYGTVFKGNLENGCLVAVKILSESKGNGEEFVNEVTSIGRTSHVNIVSLLGFSSEGAKRALIYDFMCNGSLEKLTYYGKPKIFHEWEMLYQIATGIARGLEYLHHWCNTRIVHFDIKPHNILLDRDFCPKISDFGLAKLCPEKGSILSMADARGTIGYIAPEVFSRNFGVVSSKSDVYSYGMMVLEMAGGRKNIFPNAEKSSENYFPHWLYKQIDQNRDLEACGVTPETEEIARKMILVGLWCIQTMPENRPSTSRVIEMLEGSVNDLRMPPKPYLTSPLTSFKNTSSINEDCWNGSSSSVH